MYKKLIFSPLYAYLEEFAPLADCAPFPAAMLADTMFPNVLVKMIGSLEQKLKEISWQIGCVDLDHRRELCRGKQPDSVNFRLIKDFVLKINEQLDDTSRYRNLSEKDLDKFVEESFKILEKYFLSSNYIHSSLYNDWNTFKTHYETKIKNNIHKDVFEKKDYLIPRSVEAACKLRHGIAHHTYSYQSRLQNLNSLKTSVETDNYFTLFLSLIFVDLFLMHISYEMLLHMEKKNKLASKCFCFVNLDT